LTTLVPALPNLTWGKLFIPGDAYPMAESSWHLGVYSWSCCCVRQRWDRYSTQVHIVICVWAPMATFLHARFLRPLLLEVLGSAMLIHFVERPRVRSIGDPGSCPGRLERWDEQSGGGEILAPFVVSTSNTFIVSVETTDMIYPIRKTASLW
jgi:hypothetical protein